MYWQPLLFEVLAYLPCAFYFNQWFLHQNAGLPEWSSSQIRSQDVHTNGPVLDETILADPEVVFSISSLS
jgi:hypothetical protein